MRTIKLRKRKGIDAKMLFVCAQMLVITFELHSDIMVNVPTVGPPSTYAASVAPFLIQEESISSMRYQQIYAATPFSAVIPHGGFITSMTFVLVYVGTHSYTWTIQNMQLNFCTTSRAVDGLSVNFAENVGADDKIVYGPGQLTFSTVGTGGRLSLVLNNPFFYDPCRGNLLFDVRSYTAGSPVFLDIPAMSAQDSPTDEVSNVYALSVDPPTGIRADSLGVRTIFQITPVPKLTITLESTNVVLHWENESLGFKPESTQTAGAAADWQMVTQPVTTNGIFKEVIVPRDARSPASFFRLIWRPPP